MQSSTGKMIGGDNGVKRDLYDKLAENPSMLHLGDVKAVLTEKGEAELSMKVEYRHINVYGVVHGGIFAVLLDTAMGFSCFCTDYDKRVMTINMNISFVGNCPEGVTVRAIGRVIHSGKRTMVTEGEVVDEAGKLLATAQGTFFVLGKDEKRRVMPGKSSSIN